MTKYLIALLIVGSVMTGFSTHSQKVKAAKPDEEEHHVRTNIVVPHTNNKELAQQILNNINEQLKQANQPPMIKYEVEGNTIWVQEITE